MKYILAILSISFLLCSFNGVLVKHVDFSGVWKVNAAQSTYGTLSPKSATYQFIVQQQEDGINIQRLSPAKDSLAAPLQYAEQLSFDSTQVAKHRRDYDAITKYTRFKWSAANEFMLSSEYREAETGGYSFQRNWQGTR